MAFSISMIRLASSVSSASPWLDMSIHALPAGYAHRLRQSATVLSFPGTYTTLRSNLANVSCYRALLAAGPEGLSTCSLCQLCKD